MELKDNGCSGDRGELSLDLWSINGIRLASYDMRLKYVWQQLYTLLASARYFVCVNDLFPIQISTHLSLT